MQQSKRMSMNECTEAMMMLKQKHEAELAFIGARQHEEWSQLVRLIACNHQETNDNSDDVIMSEGKSKKKVHYALHVVDKRKNVPDEKMECESLSGLTFVKHKKQVSGDVAVVVHGKQKMLVKGEPVSQMQCEPSKQKMLMKGEPVSQMQCEPSEQNHKQQMAVNSPRIEGRKVKAARRQLDKKS